ncbi:unnamed protein product [Prorocentrum cordatum]|uniref:Uncharacterized protein n=1 Tax=Prorocentrum cordatum TaxID=2364126 RepID=A0ABN9V5W4_9DINO|nr:unnamed protein product [Polarella glacialis]
MCDHLANDKEAGFGGLPLLAAERARWALGRVAGAARLCPCRRATAAASSDEEPAGWRPRPLLVFSVYNEIWIEYCEPPPRLAHTRIAVVGVQAADPEHFSILTPDFDVHIQECDASNDDIKNWWMYCAAGAPHGAAVRPSGVQCYFAVAPTAAQDAQACAPAAGRPAAHDRALALLTAARAAVLALAPRLVLPSSPRPQVLGPPEAASPLARLSRWSRPQPEALPLQLGPPPPPPLMPGPVKSGGSLLGHRFGWVAALGAAMPVDDPVVSTSYEFAKTMQGAQVYDQVGGFKLSAIELVTRQPQAREERYGIKLVSTHASISGGDDTGMQSTRRARVMVAPSPAEWIAKQLSAMAMERRRAREERQLPHPPASDGSGGGGAEAASDGIDALDQLGGGGSPPVRKRASVSQQQSLDYIADLYVEFARAPADIAPGRGDMWFSSGDVSNAFYAVQVPEGFFAFFSLPPVRAVLAGVLLGPRLPAAGAACVGNCLVAGCWRAKVQAVAQKVERELSSLGFVVREQVSDARQVSFVGLDIGGREHSARVSARRAWRPRCAVEELLRRPEVGGALLEFILGLHLGHQGLRLGELDPNLLVGDGWAVACSFPLGEAGDVCRAEGLALGPRSGVGFAGGLELSITYFEQMSVGMGMLLDCRWRVNSFVTCCSDLRLDWSSWAPLDVAVVASLDCLCFRGRGGGDASLLFARLPRRMRMPIPWLVVAAVAGAWLTQWQCEQTRHAGRTGLWDFIVGLDTCALLALALLSLERRTSTPSARLWTPLPGSLNGGMMKELPCAPGLMDFPAQACVDPLARRCPAREVQQRGGWASDNSFRRYVTQALAIAQLQRAGARVFDCGRLLDEQLCAAFLSGAAVPALSPTSPGSWSHARHGPLGSSSRTIRSWDYIWGLSDLGPRPQAAVDIGNAQLRFALSLVSLRRSMGVPVYLENPGLSWVWVTPGWQALLKAPDASLFSLDMCAFGDQFYFCNVGSGGASTKVIGRSQTLSVEVGITTILNIIVYECPEPVFTPETARCLGVLRVPIERLAERYSSGIFQQWFNLDTATDPRMPAGDPQILVSKFEQAYTDAVVDVYQPKICLSVIGTAFEALWVGGREAPQEVCLQGSKCEVFGCSRRFLEVFQPRHAFQHPRLAESLPGGARVESSRAAAGGGPSCGHR